MAKKKAASGFVDTDHEGVPGQLQYPERVVDAERAAAYAGGKEDTLSPESEEE